MYTNNNEYIFKVMKCLIFVDCKCATAKEKQSKAKQRKMCEKRHWLYAMDTLEVFLLGFLQP